MWFSTLSATFARKYGLENMRKFILLAFIVCSAILVISSCGGKSGGNGVLSDSITFDSVKVDSTVALSEDTTGPRCHVSLCITYAKGKNADYINDSIIRSGILSPDYFSITSQKISIQEAADSFLTRYLSEYKRDYGELYRADKAHSASYNCEYIVKTRVEQETDKYLTYIADIYNYGGGAHGISIVITKNIDVNTGKIVTLKDLFVPGYEQKLNELIVKGLCEKFEVKDFKGLNDKAVLLGMDVYAPDNFIIGKKNITFIYSPDEIAYHAAGEIRVTISNSDIEDLLKK